MNSSNRWTIGRKLMTSFFLVSVITALTGAVGFYSITSGAKAIDQLGTVQLPGIDSLLAIKEGSENIRGTMRTLGIPGLPIEMRRRQYDNLTSTRAKYEAAWKAYEALPRTKEEVELWGRFGSAWSDWRTENTKYIEMCKHFDENGIANPAELTRQLERFTKDHYALTQRILHLLHMENAAFDGGDDHTTCNAGKWMATFKTDNS